MQNPLFQQTPIPMRSQRGLSLIELMVGILISSILLLGMYQIFSASRVTFQMQEGLSRVQENGRFAMDYLQRSVRMVGFLGCGSDLDRTNQASFVNHLSETNGSMPPATGAAYRFQRPIEAYSVGSSATADFTAIAAGPVAERPLANTDVLVLRILSEESVPVLTVSKASGNLQTVVRIADPASPVFSAAGANAIYAMQNCRSADVFQASLSGSDVLIDGLTTPNVYRDPTVVDCSDATGGCPWDFRVSNAFLNAKPLVGAAVLNGELHRAEYLGIYVRNNSSTPAVPSLYVRRFARAGGPAGAIAPIGTPEELAEGVETLLLRFGVDTDGDNVIDDYRTAAQVINGVSGDIALDNAWRQVVSVRVGVLARSSERAGVYGKVGTDARTYQVLGTTITPPDDGRMRQVYETTIAVRNRLLN